MKLLTNMRKNNENLYFYLSTFVFLIMISLIISAYQKDRYPLSPEGPCACLIGSGSVQLYGMTGWEDNTIAVSLPGSNVRGRVFIPSDAGVRSSQDIAAGIALGKINVFDGGDCNTLLQCSGGCTMGLEIIGGNGEAEYVVGKCGESPFP